MYNNGKSLFDESKENSQGSRHVFPVQRTEAKEVKNGFLVVIRHPTDAPILEKGGNNLVSVQVPFSKQLLEPVTRSLAYSSMMKKRDI